MFRNERESSVREPKRAVGKYGTQRVRDRILLTVIPNKGHLNVLSHRYENRSDYFGTDLVFCNQVF